MAPSNPSVLSPSPSPAGTIVSPLTSMSTSTSTTTNASAQGESSAGDYTKITSQSNNSGPGRSGRWTPDEKLLFLHGLKLHGRGRWKKIRYYLPTRTLIQIKSHAQKVLKREELGDNVFCH
ncbi:hypothetical protein MHU86_13382 [Fragilaria crotonensis]|nr:hypothetical protein MHU86_13382 [Fragilaria crotonensis]